MLEVPLMDVKVKKRGWIKNAVIIFLAVMLVLTFFSQTILNRSLPEVATQYIQNGTITARIRGSGTVSANYIYEVKIKETRTVKTVAVRTGDRVDEGSVLFILSDEPPAEVDDLERQLDMMVLNYQKMLIDAGGADYALQRRSIERAREDLNEAIANRDSLYVSDAQITAAQQAIPGAKAHAESLQDRLDELGEQIAELQDKLNAIVDSGVPGSEALADALRAVKSAETELQNARAYQTQANNAASQAERDLSATRTSYSIEYDKLKNIAIDQYKANNSGKIPSDAALLTYMSSLAAIYAESLLIDEKSMSAAFYAIESAEYALSAAFAAQSTAVFGVTAAAAALADANANYNRIYAEYTAGQASSSQTETQRAQLKAQISSLETQRKAVQKQHTDALSAITAAETALMELQNRRAEHASAAATVKGLQIALDTELFNLAEQQKNDAKMDQKTSLDLANSYKEITELREKIEKVKTGTSSTEILSEVSGIVKSINITAGNTTEYDRALAVIEVTDRGYSLTFPVTLEQAKKVQIGDAAELTNYWWGPAIKATLINIIPDPEKPSESRLLMFDMQGEVNSGDQYNLAIGQRSANYDMVVPNSAIRTDANGTFVLIIVAKSSPLSNRYIATRVDVNVLASDDTNTAISGGVVSWDYVITTSTVPVEPGTQVRIAGNR